MFLAAGAVVFMVLLCLITPEPKAGSGSGVTMNLPNMMNGYFGYEMDVSQAELDILPGDTEFERKTYVSATGDKVNCSIVLSGAEKRSIHRPEICLPGQGWTIKSVRTHEIKVPGYESMEVTDLSLERPYTTDSGERIRISQHYFYWFVGQNAITPHNWERIFLTSWDRVVHRVNHRWAYVTVSSMVTEGLQPFGKNSEETVETLKAFTSIIAPKILRPAVLDSKEE
ncbi:MAG: exosortase-associated EpsI family protein [Verrucomicrobiota bacterium]